MSGGPLKLSLGQALACRRVHHGHVRPRVATKSVNSTIDFRSDFVDMPFLLRGHLLENMRSLLLVNTAKSPWLPPRFYGFGARSFDSPPTPRAPVTPEKSKATMVKNDRLARAISDVAWSSFVAVLTHKVAKTGGEVVQVSPNNTSQLCSACGSKVPKTLAVRVHQCACGLVLDRDVNASTATNQPPTYLSQTEPEYGSSC
jgi:Putative transposase DNA-binding domain